LLATVGELNGILQGGNFWANTLFLLYNFPLRFLVPIATSLRIGFFWIFGIFRSGVSGTATPNLRVILGSHNLELWAMVEPTGTAPDDVGDGARAGRVR